MINRVKFLIRKLELIIINVVLDVQLLPFLALPIFYNMEHRNIQKCKAMGPLSSLV